MNANPILTQLMDVAQSLVQTRGYNAMSYRDLADEVGIKTSSIHYYFPTKEDLGNALLVRYRTAFKGVIAMIDAEVTDPKLKLERYVDLFVDTARTGKICLGGMFATDSSTLPASMQEEIKRFYAENEAWLAGVCKQGRDAGKFSFDGPPRIKAEILFSMLEGVLIAARLFKEERRLLSAGEWILSSLTK